MNRYVVDASVGAKWLFPEPDSGKALSLISRGVERLVPDLFFAEIGNIAWKRVRTGELSNAQALDALQRLAIIPLATFPVSRFMDLAFEIAAGYGRTFYDSAYLALAVREDAILLTADARLVRSLSNSPLARSIFDISDLSVHP